MFTLRHTAVAIMAAFALTACSQGSGDQAQKDTAQQGGEQKINVIIATANPLTGPFAHWGKDAADGIKLAVDEANAKNIEWNGQKVYFEYMSEDDQGDPKTAAQVAARYADKKINVMVGHLTTGPSMVASKVYDENGIPEIVYSVTGPQFTEQGYKGVFRVIANDNQQGDALAEYAVNTLGVKNFAIVQDKTTYGEGLANAFADAAQKQGLTLVDTQYTTNSATEFGAIVTALKQKAPELIFYGGMDAQAAPLVREMRRQGLEAKFMGADGVKTPEFIKLAGDSAAGVYGSTTGAPKENLPGFADFDAAYQKAYGKEMVAYSPYAYDATNVVIEAMNKAQSADAEKYVPLMRETDYAGVTGQIQFKENGDIKNGVVTLYQVKDGDWSLLK